MTNQAEMFEYAWRAALLAKVMFTRRTDLDVRAEVEPWDLFVELLDGDAHTGQVFAIEVKATLKPEGLGRVLGTGEVALRGEWLQHVEREAERDKDAPFPVCFIGVAMTTDTGYFAWIRRPVRDGSADGLVTERPEHLLPFTDESVDEIVANVREWYRQRRRHAAAV